MLEKVNVSTYGVKARLTALLLALITSLGATSCGLPGRPADTTEKPITTAPPVTEAPVREEVALVNTVFTSTILKGDIPGPYTDTGETVFITMGVPEGMGGGYREFEAKNDEIAKKTGFSVIWAEDVISFNSKYLAVQTTEATLASLRPDISFTLMDTDKRTFADGRTVSVFYTFEKVSGVGLYSAYCYLLAADGMSVIPFVCRFEGFSAFRDKAVREYVMNIAESLTVHEDGYEIKLSDGLESRTYSLYDNLPDGYTVSDVVHYSGNYLAIFARDKAGALYFGFFDYIANTLTGGWKKLYDKPDRCEVFYADGGLTVCPAYGKYYTVTGEPGNTKVQLITKTFSDALYSDCGEYCAYVQGVSGNVVIENLETGRTTVIYSPQTESVNAHETRKADLVCFSSDSTLIFRIDGSNGAVGFGSYSTAAEKVAIYENGLTPIGCTATHLWCMRMLGGEYTEISRAELAALDKFESMYVRGGDRKEGFFDNYEDIFFESRIILNKNGTHFVLFPADDASRISIFSANTFECIYTTPVPNISEVIPLEKQIIIGTQGWGTLYTVELPSKSTPGGSFDHESVVEVPNNYPDYKEVMELIGYSAPYFYKPAKGAKSFAASNIIYYLLNYAASHDLGEEYIEYIMPEKPNPETEAVTTAPETSDAITEGEEVADVVTTDVVTTDVVTTDAVTGDVVTTEASTDAVTVSPVLPEEEPEPIEVLKYKVQIYTLKKLAWELLGITEDYFDAYIMDPAPEIEISDEAVEEETDEAADTAEVTTAEATDAVTTEAVTEEIPAEEKLPENAYIGMEGSDRYDRDTGYFHFIPNTNTQSGWNVELGGTVIVHSANKLTAKTVLVAPDGTRMNAEYTVEAINDYYRITAISISTSVNVTENIPAIDLLGTKYAPLWYAVEKGSNRVYYPLTEIAEKAGINAVVREPQSHHYADSATVFGDAYMYGGKAVISVYRNGIYDILAVDMTSGESALLGGNKGLANVVEIVTEMVKTGTSYPYYGARMLGASANGAHVLYLVSNEVNKLPARYYVYDLATGQSTEICSSLTSSRADTTKIEYFEWMTSSRVRISVWEAQGVLLKNVVYEAVLAGGKWSVVKTNYQTNGISWTGTGGADIEEDEDVIVTEPPIAEEDYLKLWTDITGSPDVGLPLDELAMLFYEAKLDAIAKREDYSTLCTSEYIVTLRTPTYIMMTEYAEMMNADGKPTGNTKFCQNICEVKNGEWVWTKITLP